MPQTILNGIININLIFWPSLILFIYFTEGFVLDLGSFKVKANHLKNPIAFLAISIGLKLWLKWEKVREVLRSSSTKVIGSVLLLLTTSALAVLNGWVLAGQPTGYQNFRDQLFVLLSQDPRPWIFAFLAFALFIVVAGLVRYSRRISWDVALTRLSVISLPLALLPVFLGWIFWLHEDQYFIETQLFISIVTLVVAASLAELPFSLRQAHISRQLIILMAAVFGLYVLAALLRHFALFSRMYDLAIFDNVFWNSINGNFFYSDIMGHNYLGEHFNLLLIPIIPLYTIWPTPTLLLTIQSLALVLGAWPLYLLGRKKNLPGFLNFSLVFAYLLYLPLFGINMGDFHELAFMPVLTLWALYFLELEKIKWFCLFIGLSFLTKENVLLNGLFIGAYLGLAKRKWKLGGVLALVSLGIFLWYTQHLVPLISGASYPYFSERYGLAGGDIKQVVGGIILDPTNLVNLDGWEHILQKIIYLGHAFYPLLFLPLFSGWAVLLFFIPLLSILLSNFHVVYDTPFTQYGAVYIPFTFYATILVLAKIKKERLLKIVALYFIIHALAIAFMWDKIPVPGRQRALFATNRKFSPSEYITSLKTARNFWNMKKLVPPEASLSASRNLAPHLSQRREIYSFSYKEGLDADYIMVDMSFEHRKRLGLLANVLESKTHGVIAFDNRFVVAQKGASVTSNGELIERLRHILGE